MSDIPSYRIPKATCDATLPGLASNASVVTFQWPFSTSPPLRQAIQDALCQLSAMRGCASPPFWDAYEGWASEFQEQVLRFKEGRSIEHLEASDFLEDLLVAQQSRRADIARVALYQSILELPPLHPRNGVSELRLIPDSILSGVLENLGPARIHAALADPRLPSNVRSWLSPRAGDNGPLGQWEVEDGSTLDVSTESAVHLLIQELMSAIIRSESLLSPPENWIGSSCLDMRIEDLSTLGQDQLAKWPDAASLRIASFGLAPSNREKLKVLVPTCAPIPDDQMKAVHSWKGIAEAQRRISWWIDLVRFDSKYLDCYHRMKSIDISDHSAIQAQERIPDFAWKILQACLTAYR